MILPSGGCVMGGFWQYMWYPRSQSSQNRSWSYKIRGRHRAVSSHTQSHTSRLAVTCKLATHCVNNIKQVKRAFRNLVWDIRSPKKYFFMITGYFIHPLGFNTHIVLWGATQTAGFTLDALPLVRPNSLHHVVCELQTWRMAWWKRKMKE